MTWEQTFEQQVAHFVELAQKPGWWAYTQQQIIAMETEPGQAWKGLRAAWGQRLKAMGFQPPAEEVGNWWDVPSKLPPAPRAAPTRVVVIKDKGPWHEADRAYQLHAVGCHQCVAAGKGYGERCGPGAGIWAKYSALSDELAGG